MRILIVSDCFSTSWGSERRRFEALVRALRGLGHLVESAGPAVPGGWARLCDSFLPEAVYVDTDTAAGRAVRELCRSRGMPYSTGDWAPGVDLSEFRPTGALAVDTTRPVTAWSGRLDGDRAVRLYLESRLGGTRFVIGEGRLRRALSREFPTARFVGELPARALAPLYSCLDAFVHTDVSRESPVEVLEALACGTPVVCLPARGAARLMEACPGVAFDEDLARGVALVAGTPKEDCVRGAALHPASASARTFAAALVRGTWSAPFDGAALAMAA